MLSIEWSGLSFTYDGKDHMPEAAASNAADGDKVAFEISEAKKAAGEYEAKITSITGEVNQRNYRLPRVTTQTFKIEKLTAELEWGEAEFIYNGKDQIPTVSVKNLISGDTCELTVTGAATAVGTHTATVTRLSNSNYELPENAECTCTIAKAKLPVDEGETQVMVIMNHWTYGEDPAEPVIQNNIGGGSVNYSYAELDLNKDDFDQYKTFTYTPNKPSDAGLYIIKAEIGATENYEAATVYNAFAIFERVAELSWTDISFVYDGEEHCPKCEVTNLVNGDKCVVTVTGATSEVGDNHTATAIELDNKNYELPATTTQTFAISKDTLALVVSMTGWTYGDAAKEPYVEGNTGGGTVTYTYYTDEACETKTTTDDGAAAEGGVPSYAGTYYVKAEAEATAGYEAAEATAEFTI